MKQSFITLKLYNATSLPKKVFMSMLMIIFQNKKYSVFKLLFIIY